jgi:putative membrane protein
MMDGWGGPWGNGAGWAGWLMLALMILFAVAIVVGVVFLIRALWGPGAASVTAGAGVPRPAVRPPAPESPQDVLKRRYAAGEVDREEYLQRLKDL